MQIFTRLKIIFDYSYIFYSRTNSWRRKFNKKYCQIVYKLIRNISNNPFRIYKYIKKYSYINYADWIKCNENILITKIKGLYGKNKYSNRVLIICNVEDNLEGLSESLISFQKQIYDNWEVYFLIEKDLISEIKSIANTILSKENNHKISIYIDNKKIKNDILEQKLKEPNCKYFLCIKSGDQLHKMSLYYLVRSIDKNKMAVAVYCDTDVINREGERSCPYFKPDWNRELFYSHDYINNALLIKTETISLLDDLYSIGNNLLMYELLLKHIEIGSEKEIIHVPKVLYHHCIDYQKKINLVTYNNKMLVLLRNHFLKIKKTVDIQPDLITNTFHIIYDLPKNPPKVCLVIPTRDNATLLSNCIKSIIEYTIYPNYEIIIIDNNSREAKTFALFEELNKQDKIFIYKYDKEFNYSAINNYAATLADADIIGLINNDIEVIEPNWLKDMVRYAMQPEIGCVGAKLLYPNGTVQHSGVICGVGDVAGHAHRKFQNDEPGYFSRLQCVQYYSAVTAACMLVRKDIYKKVGGMNEKLAVCYNDIDFCLRVKKEGYHNIYIPHAKLYHHESVSRGKDNTLDKQTRYWREVEYMWMAWKADLENDSCYNPNLTRCREDFSL